MSNNTNNAMRNRQYISDCIDGPGFAMFSVGYGECSVPGCRCEAETEPWSYTIGRVELGQPEFVVLGLPPDMAVALANWVHRRWDVRPSLAQRPARFPHGHLVRIDPVPSTWVTSDPNRMGQWFGYYEGMADLPGYPDVVQLVSADHYGRFPDDPRCNRFVVASQPLLAQDPLSYPSPYVE